MKVLENPMSVPSLHSETGDMISVWICGSVDPWTQTPGKDAVSDLTLTQPILTKGSKGVWGF